MSPLVVVPVDELTELIEGAVARGLDSAAPQAQPPALLDRAGLARALGVSPSTVARLQRQGLPTVRVGDSPRYRLAAALAWLEKRGGQGA